MSKICPMINQTVLYLDCLECDDKQECQNIGKEKKEEKQMENRYDALLGPNSKQFWLYDNENNTYIDPPTEVLEKMDEIRYKDGEETADSIDEAESWLENLANNEEPDWLHDGNEHNVLFID